MLGCGVGGSTSVLQPHIKFFNECVSQIIPAISWPVLGQCLDSGKQIALCTACSVGCQDDVPAECLKGDIGRTLRAECFPDERECRGYSPLPEPQFNAFQSDNIFINHCIQSFCVGVKEDALAPFIPFTGLDVDVGADIHFSLLKEQFNLNQRCALAVELMLSVVDQTVFNFLHEILNKDFLIKNNG